jgi:hypothetical protein
MIITNNIFKSFNYHQYYYLIVTYMLINSFLILIKYQLISKQSIFNFNKLLTYLNFHLLVNTSLVYLIK